MFFFLKPSIIDKNKTFILTCNPQLNVSKISDQQNISFQTSVKLAAYSHSAADSPKIPPKKLESSPTTHVTETRFLHVLDPPDHFGTIYIFDEFFQFFFNKFSRKKLSPELAAYSHSAADSPKKVRVQKHPQKS